MKTKEILKYTEKMLNERKQEISDWGFRAFSREELAEMEDLPLAKKRISNLLKKVR